MKRCGYCGRENDPSVTCCRECGTELPAPPSPQTQEEIPHSKSELTAPARPASNVVATLCPDEALSLLEFLQKEQIPAEMRTRSEESGLEMKEVLVEDCYYDSACAAAEQWQNAVIEAASKKSGKRCPKCGSWDFEYLSHDKLDHVIQCKKCGCQFL